MNTEELQTLEIPLSKLLVWNDNVRRTGAEEGIGELADSIAAVGLLQGLVVKKEPRGKFAVIAGRRRLLALPRLAEEGKVKRTMTVPCRIASEDADLPEISLTENVMHVAMHPADEFEAFQRLIATGKSVPDVAARFAVTEAVGLRRLALARVSPTLLAKYREGELNLELLQAFTLTDDHNAQEEVWSQLQPWDRKPHTVRQMLASDDIPASDKRVRFIGLAFYEAAGGLVRRDLFAGGEAGTYILDSAKLNRLVSEKLQTIAEASKSEGWKWIEIQPEVDHRAISRYRRTYAPELPLSAEAQAEIDGLEEKRYALVNKMEEFGDDAEEVDPQLYDHLDQIDRRIQAIRRDRKAAYSDEAKANCGVVVSIGHNGEPTFVYGLLRKEDEEAIAAQEIRTEHMQPNQAVPESEPESSAYSAALIEALTQHKTAAIAAELSQDPKIALSALAHALVLSEFGLDLQLYRSRTCVQLSTRNPYLQDVSEAPAYLTLEQQKREWLGKLATAKDLWTWCLEQDQQTTLKLLAYCVARTVNGVRAKSDTENSGSRLDHADAMATALGFDIRKWFTPTAENFFSKISKSSIADALAEAGKPASSETLKLKKPLLALFAESQIKATAWLPEPVRIPAANRRIGPTRKGDNVRPSQSWSRLKTKKQFHVLTESVRSCPSVRYENSADGEPWRLTLCKNILCLLPSAFVEGNLKRHCADTFVPLATATSFLIGDMMSIRNQIRTAQRYRCRRLRHDTHSR